MFKASDLFKHTDKTRRILTSMQLGASGWTAHQVNPEELRGPQVFLYVWDRPTQWAWMCAVPLEVFEKVTADVRGLQAEWDGIRGHLARLINSASAGEPLEVATETELGILLSAYAGTTQVLGVARETGMRELHFVVLNYRANNLRDGKLRPFVLPSERAILPGHEFYSRVQEVVSLDSKRHPEWF